MMLTTSRMKKILILGALFIASPLTLSAASTATLFPNGQGTYTAWAGTESLIDETGTPSCSILDGISTVTSNSRESVNLILSSIPNGATITSVNVSVWYSATGINNAATFKTFARIASTNTDASANLIANSTTSSCGHNTTQSIDVPDTVKSDSTQVEIGVLKTATDTSGVRVGALRATVIYTLPQPITADIKANSSDGPITLNSGDPFSYSWTSTVATACQLTSPSGFSGITLNGTDGPITPNHPWYPTTGTPTTLTLNCTNGTSSKSDSVVINLAPPPYAYPTPTLPNLDKGLVSLTFDDGTQSIYDNAIPVLNTAGFKSTQYIITSAMFCADGGFGCQDFMNSSEIKSLYNSGHEIAAHTRTDRCAPGECSTGVGSRGLSLIDQLFEVDGLRLDLLRGIGVPVNTFAYPFGEFDDALISKLKSAGIVGARTVNFINVFGQPSYNEKIGGDRYKLFAAQINANTPITASDAPLTDGAGNPRPEWGHVESWINGAITAKKWLILVFHEVKQDCAGELFCITPSQFGAITSYLQSKASDLNVVTVSQGLSWMDNKPVSNLGTPVITIPEAGGNNTITVSASSSGASSSPRSA